MKKIIIIAGSFVVLLLLVNIFFYKITYYADVVQSHVYDFLDNPATGNQQTTGKSGYQEYIKTYEHLPSGFLQIGSMLMYKPKTKVSVNSIASYTIQYTDYFVVHRFAAAIRRLNKLPKYRRYVYTDEAIIIPGTSPSFIRNTLNRKKPVLRHVKGLYFTGTSSGRRSLLKKLPGYKRLGINAIVFDAKDVTGIVNYYSRVPEVRKYNTHGGRTIGNVRKLIRELNKYGIYSIARVAVFHDHLMVKKNPRWSIRSKRTGGVWMKGHRDLWCDPSNKKVQDYNIKIALELAEMGVDEIQFDYIRFPTEGYLRDAAFRYDFGRMKNEDVIAHFLKRAYTQLKKKNVNVSIDIFGVVAWGKEIDIQKTGQRIESLAKYCDVISPMLYPSHFNDDFDGFARPGDNPYYFIHKGCKKVINLAKNKVVVRPWLQAFGWRVSNYNAHYIIKQVKGSDDSGAKGYLFWNSGNNYSVVYRAMKAINNVTNYASEKNENAVSKEDREDNDYKINDDIGG